MKHTYVISFQEIDRSMSLLAGGKGANLGELSRIEGIQVPEGFCITTEAYKEITGNDQALKSLLDALTHLKAAERSAISEVSAKIRRAIRRAAYPPDIQDEISVNSAGLTNKRHLRCGPALRQKTCQLPLLQANRTLTSI